MKVVFASALLCCSLAAFAENEANTSTVTETSPENHDAKPLSLVLAAGLTIGGDDMASTTDGGTLEAGGMIYLAAGGVFHYSPNLDLQTTFGIHFDELTATNGTAKFTRTFIEFMPFYVMDNGHRFGVGYTKVMSPKYSDPIGTINFEDSNGMIVQFDWMLNHGYFVGFRFADLDYTIDGFSGSLDGSYFGVVMQGHF